MTQSGQINAQEAQAIHLSISTTSATLYPCRLKREEGTIISVGQTVAQSRQPLQRSSSNTTRDIIFPIFNIKQVNLAGN